MTTPEIDVYQSAARNYFKSGWHPLPLPARAKKPPPDNCTGYDGVDFTLAEIEAEDWTGNIATRAPVDVLGIDVDVYHGGDKTLAKMVADLGPLPPTFISHNGRNDGSGIRWFRVPVGHWVHNLPGIEIVQRGHRYGMVWPSIHPEGRPYRWHDQAEQADIDYIPEVEDLPELPFEWQAELMSDNAEGEPSSTSPVEGAGVTAFFSAHEQADAPSYVATILQHFRDKVQAGHSRHDTMTHCLIWAMECCAAEIASARPTVELLGERWVAAFPEGGRRAELRSGQRVTEFELMVRHAIGKVQAKPPEFFHKLHDEIAGPRFVPGVLEPELIEMELPLIDPRTNEPVAGRLLADVRRQLASIEARDVARLILVEREFVPPPVPVTVAHLLANPPAVTASRIETILPRGGRAVMVAPRKVGKTTLMVNVVRSLTLGENLFGRWRTDPARCHFLNFEVTGDQFARWCEEAGVDPGLLVSNLRGKPNPFLTARSRRELVSQIKDGGAEVLIVDPYSVASVGMVEREGDNVAIRSWLAMLDELADDAGCGELIVTVHGSFKALDPDAARGGTALEDWPDAIWRLSADEDSGERFFAAIGRDVEVAADRLTFNPQNRRLSFGAQHMGKEAARFDRFKRAVVAAVAAAPGINTGDLRDQVRSRVPGFGNDATVNRYLKRMDEEGDLVRRSAAGLSTEHFLPGQTTP